MIRIDFREGSWELQPFIDVLGVGTLKDDLAVPGGDFAFEGHGPKGLSMFGIERKRIKDFMSNMHNNHYVGVQLPRMCTHYDVRYLLIEGIVRPNPQTGILEMPGRRNREGILQWNEVTLGRRRFMWEDFEKYITSLEWAPIRVIRTSGPDMTAATLVAKYHYYQKRWDKHNSLKGLFYTPYPTISMDLSDKEDYFRLVCASMPHIGPEKSLIVSKRFKNIWNMAHASVSDWQQLPGIGDVISNNLYKFIHGIQEA